MRLFAASADAWPSTDSAPESGKRIAMIIRIVVVFPAPFGPMKPYNAPRGIARSRSMTALVVPKLLHTFWSRMASGIAVESTARDVREARYVPACDANCRRSGRERPAAVLVYLRAGDAERRMGPAAARGSTRPRA